MSPREAAAALLQVVALAHETKCRALRDRAEVEARAILHEAHADARKRMRSALEGVRANAVERVARAEAQSRTRERAARQRQLKARLDRTWQRLDELLRVAWQEPAQRAQWAQCYALGAAALLPAGRWEILHPSAWLRAEQEQVREILSRYSIQMQFTPDPAIAAGLRFVSGNSMLDATAGGLLAERPAVEARLLFHAQAAQP